MNTGTAAQMMKIYMAGAEHSNLKHATYMATACIRMIDFHANEFWEHYAEMLNQLADNP
jgi:hypothetical protein